MNQRILKYFISLFFLLDSTVYAQHESGIRVGVDVFTPASSFFTKGRSGAEGLLDIRFKKNYYLAFEPGFRIANFSDSTFTYNSSGAFLRVGLDKNFLNNPKYKGNNTVNIGLRYGISAMANSAPDIKIPSGYWNPDPVMMEIPSDAFMSHWLELKAGVKAEVLRNFFIGWSIAGKLLLSSGHQAGMTPYMIPGYGRGDRKTAFGFNYYLCYMIPFSSGNKKDHKAIGN